jgi:hypothetical protein
MHCVPFSPDIPWVQVCRGRGPDVFVACQACGEEGSLPAHEAAAFAGAHREHSAGPDHVGLGDVIAAVAKPIAALFGQEPCTPCEARRRAANQVRMRRRW